jgi:hypothetical protein
MGSDFRESQESKTETIDHLVSLNVPRTVGLIYLLCYSSEGCTPVYKPVLDYHFAHLYLFSDSKMLSIKIPWLRELDISRLITLTCTVYHHFGLLTHLYIPRLYAARLAQPVSLSSFQELLPSLVIEYELDIVASTFIVSSVLIHPPNLSFLMQFPDLS